MSEPQVHTMVSTKEAVDVITAADLHARLAFEAWGRLHTYEHPADAVKHPGATTLTSWTRNVSQLFGTFFGGQSRICKDGVLGLYVSTSSGFVYGVVFHRADRDIDPMQVGDRTLTGATSTLMGRYCGRPAAEGDGACLSPIFKGACPDHGEHGYVLALPIPGEWSFHS